MNIYIARIKYSCSSMTKDNIYFLFKLSPTLCSQLQRRNYLNNF